MRRTVSEKNIVVVLFVIVLVVFSLAQEDTKKIEKMYLDTNSSTTLQADESSQNDLKKKEIIPAAELR